MLLFIFVWIFMVVAGVVGIRDKHRPIAGSIAILTAVIPAAVAAYLGFIGNDDEFTWAAWFMYTAPVGLVGLIASIRSVWTPTKREKATEIQQPNHLH